MKLVVYFFHCLVDNINFLTLEYLEFLIMIFQNTLTWTFVYSFKIVCSKKLYVIQSVTFHINIFLQQVSASNMFFVVSSVDLSLVIYRRDDFKWRQKMTIATLRFNTNGFNNNTTNQNHLKRIHCTYYDLYDFCTTVTCVIMSIRGFTASLWFGFFYDFNSIVRVVKSIYCAVLVCLLTCG